MLTKIRPRSQAWRCTTGITLFARLCIDRIYCSIPGVSKETYTAYLNLFNLVGLDSLRWREDMFNRAMMAVALLKILKATNYFPQKSDADSFTSDEVRFALLLHCLMFYS